MYFYDCYCARLTCYTEEAVDYTYNSGTNTVTVHLTGWKFLTPFKVLVKNDVHLQEHGDSHGMMVSNAGTLIGFKITCDTFKVLPLVSEASYTGGVRETDGVAFYFSSFSATEGATVTFTLRMVGPYGLVGLVPYNKVSDRNITVSNTTCQEIDVNYASFVQ